jgi:hypothetical protein
MTTSGMVREPGLLVEEELQAGAETVLAAALAATLVAYRRHKEKQNGRTDSRGAGSRWRTMARLEQMVRQSKPGL